MNLFARQIEILEGESEYLLEALEDSSLDEYDAALAAFNENRAAINVLTYHATQATF